MHGGKYGDVEAELAGVQQAAIAVDIALLLQRPDAAQAGRRRDADPLGQLDIRDSTVSLNLGENFQVDVV
ncbi:hypothetical protein ABH974_002463 [Bradyrhizobium ottawaense]